MDTSGRVFVRSDWRIQHIHGRKRRVSGVERWRAFQEFPSACSLGCAASWTSHLRSVCFTTGAMSDRTRIREKLGSSGHAEQMEPRRWPH